MTASVYDSSPEAQPALHTSSAPPIPPIEARLHGHRHWLARDRDAVRHHYDRSRLFS
jgi:hypothetical protein